MFLFQPPSPTRYDLRFNLFGFPVTVHPLFWVVAALLGSAGGDIIQLLVWVLAVLISILVHELGHALAMRRHGIPSQIILHFSGGLTVPESMPWGGQSANVAVSPNQEIFISLAGPFAGFILAAVVWASVFLSGGTVVAGYLFGVIPLPLTAVLPIGGSILTALVLALLWINIFWGLINLVPVYPLDGGNVARNLLLKADPLDGVRKSLWVSVIAGGLMAVVGFFVLGSLYMAILFGFLAFQSYQSLQVYSGRY